MDDTKSSVANNELLLIAMELLFLNTAY